MERKLIAIFLLSAFFGAFISLDTEPIAEKEFNPSEKNQWNNSGTVQKDEVKVDREDKNFTIPDEKLGPRWHAVNTGLPFYTMKKNFCQMAQVTVAKELTPYFEVCLNRDGFRDRNYSKEKPPEEFRIAALGDAVTFGLGVNESQTWPSYLHKDLEARYSGRDFQVMNFGIPFVGTRQEVLWFNRTGREYEPDLVVLQYMDNDAQNKTRVHLLQERFKERLPDNISRERKRDVANRMAIRRERNERKNMTLKEELENVDTYMDRLEKYSESDDFDVFIVYHTTQYTQRHLSYLRNETAENNWGLMVSNLDADTTYYGSFYLAPEGHRKKAESLAGNLSKQGFLSSTR